MVARSMAYCAGAVTVALLAGRQLGALEPPQTPSPTAVSTERALLDQYCIGCHNDTAKVGGLSLTAVDPANVGAHPEVWEAAVRKLRTRAMPPVNMRRPDEGDYDRLVSSLEARLDKLAASRPDPGRTDTFRRLTRIEYQNAIRDLFAVDLDVTELLPKDDASYGFDNVSAVGLSPTLLERYLSAAQKVARLAVGSPVPAPGSRVVGTAGRPHAGRAC